MLNIEGRSKPLIKWAGGKSSLLKQLKEFFPSGCRRYFEPFLGGGAIFLALEKNIRASLSDVNEEIVNLYKVARDNPFQLMKVLDSYAKKYSEEFYYKLRAATPMTPVERAARTILLNKTGFNGLYRQNASGKFNVPFGKREKCPALYTQENLINVSERLKNAEISCGDFSQLISKAGEGDVVYVDPPYDVLSSTSSFQNYFKSGFGRDEQKRLFNGCREASERGALVLVSNAATDFIKDLYKDEDLNEVKARRAINSNGAKRGEINELVISFTERLPVQRSG